MEKTEILAISLSPEPAQTSGNNILEVETIRTTPTSSIRSSIKKRKLSAKSSNSPMTNAIPEVSSPKKMVIDSESADSRDSFVKKLAQYNNGRSSSKIHLMMRSMSDIRKAEKENSDRMKILVKRIKRKFSHLFTPQEFKNIQRRLLTMKGQSEALYTKTQGLAETAQQIMHHELIARQYMVQRDLSTSTGNNSNNGRKRVEELKKTFISKLTRD